MIVSVGIFPFQAETSYVGNNTCTIHIPTGTRAAYEAAGYSIYRLVEEDLTPIKHLTTEEYEKTATVKDVIYDLQGRRVNNPMKGHIYIVNGKKVVKK